MSAKGRPEREYRSAQREGTSMSPPGRPEDVHASGAKPRREARVRERGWQPTRSCDRYLPAHNEAANTAARSAKVLR
jgi:hypothetical protein